MRRAHPFLPALLPAVLAACALFGASVPAHAEAAIDIERARGDRGNDDDRDTVSGGGGSDLPPYLQCVPYARQVTGIQIRGDAWTWWSQAEGRYARGARPRIGAVMTFSPHGKMELGHVAAVSKIIDSRTVLLRHANWSPINGRRGQIEDNVRAVDVSPDNDWSQVRVWFAPIRNLGSTAWPVQGFIYPKRVDKAPKGARLIDAGSDPIGAIIASRLALKR